MELGVEYPEFWVEEVGKLFEKQKLGRGGSGFEEQQLGVFYASTTTMAGWGL